MYTSTTAFFVNPIISVLEHRYPRVSRVPAKVRYIVVLGGDIPHRREAHPESAAPSGRRGNCRA